MRSAWSFEAISMRESHFITIIHGESLDDILIVSLESCPEIFRIFGNFILMEKIPAVSLMGEVASLLGVIKEGNAPAGVRHHSSSHFIFSICTYSYMGEWFVGISSSVSCDTLLCSFFKHWVKLASSFFISLSLSTDNLLLNFCLPLDCFFNYILMGQFSLLSEGVNGEQGAN